MKEGSGYQRCGERVTINGSEQGRGEKGLAADGFKESRFPEP